MAATVASAPSPADPAVMAPTGSRVSFFVRLSLLVAVVFYVLYRVLVLDLTSDECGGLGNIYSKSVADLLTFKYVDAQNHYLQGLLSLFSRGLFPTAYEVVTIRLPSLIGLAAMLYAAFRLTALMGSGFLKTLGLLVLCTNAFLLDYFGLARGYGLALGFLLLGSWHLFRTFDGHGVGPHFHLALWSICIAMLCNLAWLCHYLSICFLLSCHVYMSESSDNMRGRILGTLSKCQPIFYNMLFVGALYLPRVILLNERQALYFGGSRGFIEDTVQSLVKGVLYVPDTIKGMQYEWLAYGAFAVCGLASCVAIYRLWKERPLTPVVKASGLIAIVLVLSALIVEMMHLFLNVKYVIERAATGFLLLALCQLVLFTASLEKWRRLVLAGLLIVLTVAGAVHLNLSHTYVRTASQMSEFVRWIGEARAKDGRHLIVGTDSWANYTIWYYIETLLGLKESEQTKSGIGFVRIYNGVTIYSVELPDNKDLFDENTDYLLLRHRKQYGQYPRPIRLVKQFPHAELDLFACEGEKTLPESTFKGIVYPKRFSGE